MSHFESMVDCFIATGVPGFGPAEQIALSVHLGTATSDACEANGSACELSRVAKSDTARRFRARAAQLAQRAAERDELARRGFVRPMNAETAKFMLEHGDVDEHWIIGR